MDKIFLYFSILRPRQWLKNLMLFFPSFLSGNLFNTGGWSVGILPFVAFSLVSSAGYIVNDLLDHDADRSHPNKCHRPLASGSIQRSVALFIAVVLAVGALVLAMYVRTSQLYFIALYIFVSLSYSIYFKHKPVIDLFCIAAGFVIRLQAGGAVFGILISEWLFLTVVLLSLFLSAGKRFSEQQVLHDEAKIHRRVLKSYPAGFLEGVLFMTGSAVLVTYTMYILSRHALLYTVPLCCFGLLRYIYMVKIGKNGDPTDALLRDPWLFTVGVLWSVMIGWGIYGA